MFIGFGSLIKVGLSNKTAGLAASHVITTLSTDQLKRDEKRT